MYGMIQVSAITDDRIGALTIAGLLRELETSALFLQ